MWMWFRCVWDDCADCAAFTFLCLPLKTTANAPCPTRSFLLYSKSPTASMMKDVPVNKGPPGSARRAPRLLARWCSELVTPTSSLRRLLWSWCGQDVSLQQWAFIFVLTTLIIAYICCPCLVIDLSRGNALAVSVPSTSCPLWTQFISHASISGLHGGRMRSFKWARLCRMTVYMMPSDASPCKAALPAEDQDGLSSTRRGPGLSELHSQRTRTVWPPLAEDQDYLSLLVPEKHDADAAAPPSLMLPVVVSCLHVSVHPMGWIAWMSSLSPRCKLCDRP